MEFSEKKRQTVTLGRTGLTVTAAGLGCGGFSRLGIGKGLDHAAGVVRSAFENGINFFDTSVLYGTEPAVRQGLSGIPRNRYILSTKYPSRMENTLTTSVQFEEGIHERLKTLGTDYIDILFIHAMHADEISYARENLYPVLLRAKQQGKIRFTAVSEQFAEDTTHEMLRAVLPDDFFDVVMVGLNLLNPSATKSVLPLTIQNRVGTLCMFAVRNALHDPVRLQEVLRFIREKDQGGLELTDDPHLLDFLLAPGVADSLPEAAYRYCRHTQGIDVVLTGTGSVDHLQENISSIEKPPLSADILAKCSELFGNVDAVSGQ